MQAALGEVHGLGVGVAAGFPGLHAVEEGAGGVGSVGVLVGQRAGAARGVPLLARSDAGVAADADVQVDDQGQLLGEGFCGGGGHGIQCLLWCLAITVGWDAPPGSLRACLLVAKLSRAEAFGAWISRSEAIRAWISRAEATGYPTQKPVRLLQRIVRASTHPGMMVLDPMCGSGTTLVAAAGLGRSFVGIDASSLAISVARKRLAAAEVELNSEA